MIWQKRLFLVFFLMAFLGVPLQAYSIGLGQIQLYSYLNEQLDAEIPLLSADEVDLEQVHVSLASMDDFKRANLARPYFLTKLRFEINQSDQNGVKIMVSTRDAVKEPVIDLLLEVVWPGGRMVRGYTLLLDPPSIDQPRRSRPKRLGAVAFDSNAQAATEQKPLSSDPKAKNFQIPAESNLFEPIVELEATPPVSDAKIVEEQTPQDHDDANKQDKLSSELNINPKNVMQKAAPTSTLNNTISNDEGIFWKSALVIVGVIGLYMAIVWLYYRQRKKSALKFPDFKSGSFEYKDYTKELEKPAEPTVNLITEEEAAVRMMLAKQYIEVRDYSSALELLEEIVDHGSDEDKKRATQLISQIS